MLAPLYRVYILASRTRTLYTGVTNNLQRRLEQHRSAPTTAFTSLYRCHRLVWFETHADPSQAIAREKQIKGWTRAKKLALITSQNPTWADLSKL